MYPAIGRNCLEQAVAIGGFQLRKGAVFENHRHHGIILSQTLEHLGVGGVAALCLFLCGQTHALKQRFAELLRGIQVEFIARKLIDIRNQLLDALLKSFAEFFNTLCVNQEALALHRGKHLGKRQLDLVKQALLAVLLNGGVHFGEYGGQICREYRRVAVGNIRARVFGGYAAQVVGVGGGVQHIGGEHCVARNVIDLYIR